jgi:signal transduction histidine kinase
MVTAFLNFARPQPLQLEEVSLSDLIADCAAELPVKTVVDVDPALAVRADERMLRLALLNLMRNGAEANPDGDVFVSAACENDTVVIEVRDTGPGISPAHLQKIFIPFFTTKAKGHGIGLALTHRIITQHGGTLTASNAPNGGALFTIKLNQG